MKRALVLAALACVPAAAETLPIPPAPAPMVPPPAALATPLPALPPLPAARPKAAAPAKKAAKPKPPTIRLGEKRESDTPQWSGAGYTTAGKVKVKADGGTLKAVLTTAAFSHSFFCAPSFTIAPVQLVQEFEIVPGAPDDPMVRVALSGTLDGYVRSENTGAAGLRLADASVTPVGGGPALWLNFPCCRVAETNRELYERNDEAPPLVLPAGRYVLTANLVVETSADGFLRSHAEAVFAPGNHYLGTWTSHAVTPPELDEEDELGLAVTVKVAATAAD